MQVHCQGYEQQVYFEALDQRLSAVEQQQRKLVRGLLLVIKAIRYQGMLVERVLKKLEEGIRRCLGRTKRYLVLKEGFRLLFIPLVDIVFIRAAGDYVQLTLREGSRFRKEAGLYSTTLTELEVELEGTDLIRVNRKGFVNMRYVEVARGDVIWVKGQEVTLSARYAEKFYGLLGKL